MQSQSHLSTLILNTDCFGQKMTKLNVVKLKLREVEMLDRNDRKSRTLQKSGIQAMISNSC